MAGSENEPGEPRAKSGADGWEPPAVGGVVELAVPAQASFLPVVRAATAGLAARLSLTFDEIEDLRIAVDEACAMVLSLPGPRPVALTCRYEVFADALGVRIGVPVDATATLPAERSFAWRVLTTHATDVRHAIDDGHAWIELRKPRSR
jgi:serine/threonine-protein kinase RsbW